MNFAKSKNIIVIEDEAECLLGEYSNGKLTGTVADLSIFSFQRSKHVTSESGGTVVTNNELLAERARKYSILGYRSLRAQSGTKTVSIDEVQSTNFIRHEFIAPNFRLPELCAAFLVA